MRTDATPEPVAVVGMGCRFPGDVNTPDEFWDLIRSGHTTASDVPDGRWDSYSDNGPLQDATVQNTIRKGNFLSDIAGFDADFFKISPREAEIMDPQQRLLLEVTWEALEHAGIPPHSLAGSETGVFMGVCTYDYGARQLENLPGIEAWTGIGSALCAISNRISYALDLRGPSMSIDTACSASLSALHVAVQSLRSGESALALVGGVNLIVSPGQTVTLDAAGALSPDGRSKPFDASADGYGRGEGCGVVALKPLSQAELDGDRVLAVVRGSAVSQDGRTEGIMAPCGAAQEHVVRRALSSTGISPKTVDYVEAHGTGTRVGDPIEAAALSGVYGRGRGPGEDCLIGSVKASIGHLEGAAGVAGIIKAVLSLERGEIPPTPLATEPNPEIPWESSGLDLVHRSTPWPERRHPRRAGVSGFGYGGTVVHVLLEAAPEPERGRSAEPLEDKTVGQETTVPLSAASAQALRDRALRLAEHVERQNAPPFASTGHTLGLRRSHLSHRAAVTATDSVDLAAKLRTLAEGASADGVTTGTGRAGKPRLVWVFSGHGSQWDGMGAGLLGSEPEFTRVIEEIDPIFREEIGFSALEALREPLGTVDRMQAMIFALQVGLAAVWRSYGVVPDAVIGHSVGEIAAAVTAGALSLKDGARLICRRSALLTEAAGRGAMAMVPLPFAEAANRLAGRSDLVAAISSSPLATVISGAPETLESVLADWAGEGIAARKVDSDVAFHSPQMAPLAARLEERSADLSPIVPVTTVYSTSRSDPRLPMTADGAYWAANLREPVRLAEAVTAAWEDGYDSFIEVSPHPVVTHSIQETLTDIGAEDTFSGTTLRRGRSERPVFLTALGQAFCAGVEVDWARLHPGGGLVDLPVYPWQHRPYWREPMPRSSMTGRGHDPALRNLLGTVTSIHGTSVSVWHTGLDDTVRPYPGSHALNGVEIVPAAVFLTTFLDAGGVGKGPAALADLSMHRPLMTAQRIEIQVVRDGTALSLASRTTDDEYAAAWSEHAAATVAECAPDALDTWQLMDPNAHRLEPADPDLVRRRLAEVGVPSTGFDWVVKEALAGEGVLRVHVRWDESTTWAPVLDAVTSVAPAFFPGLPQLRMVVGIERLLLTGRPPVEGIVEVTGSSDSDTLDVLVADAEGRPLAGVSGLRYSVIDPPADPVEKAPGLSSDALLPRLAELSGQELHAAVLEEVRSQVAEEVRRPADELHPRRPLNEQGLDSVMTVAVRRRLERRTGVELPVTLFWQKPSISAVTEYLTGVLAG